MRATTSLDAWRTDIPAIRRELLGRLFDGLEVRDGQIFRYIPAQGSRGRCRKTG
jgi:hypothetical protein